MATTSKVDETSDEKALQLLMLIENKSEELSYEEVKQLLEEGADPLESSARSLFAAIERDDDALLHLLLGYCQRKIELFEVHDQDGLNALQLASKLGHLECTSLLLSTGFHLAEHINECTRAEGNTALFLACAKGHSNVATLLLENGADPNIKNRREVYPIHVAASQGNLILLQELGHRGADMRARNKQGDTALHLSRHPIVMEFLHEQGVDPLQRYCGVPDVHVCN